MDHLVKLRPHGQGLAGSCPRALFGIFRQAGDRCHGGALRQIQDLPYRVVLRLPAQFVASALAAGTADELPFHQVLDDDLQVFLGDSLPVSHFFQRNIFPVIIFSQIDHDTERISSFC